MSQKCPISQDFCRLLINCLCLPLPKFPWSSSPSKSEPDGLSSQTLQLTPPFMAKSCNRSPSPNQAKKQNIWRLRGQFSGSLWHLNPCRLPCNRPPLLIQIHVIDTPLPYRNLNISIAGALKRAQAGSSTTLSPGMPNSNYRWKNLPPLGRFREVSLMDFPKKS